MLLPSLLSIHYCAKWGLEFLHVTVFHVTVHQIMEKLKQHRRQKLSCVWMPCLCLWYILEGMWGTSKLSVQLTNVEQKCYDIFFFFLNCDILWRKGHGFHWTSVLAWASWLYYTMNNTGICTVHCHNATPSLKHVVICSTEQA